MESSNKQIDNYIEISGVKMKLRSGIPYMARDFRNYIYAIPDDVVNFYLNKSFWKKVEEEDSGPGIYNVVFSPNETKEKETLYKGRRSRWTNCGRSSTSQLYTIKDGEIPVVDRVYFNSRTDKCKRRLYKFAEVWVGLIVASEISTSSVLDDSILAGKTHMLIRVHPEPDVNIDRPLIVEHGIEGEEKFIGTKRKQLRMSVLEKRVKLDLIEERRIINIKLLSLSAKINKYNIKYKEFTDSIEQKMKDDEYESENEEPLSRVVMAQTADPFKENK